jgi:hypothetical protein
MQVMKKTFKFAAERSLPFFFASSADGTNVSKVGATGVLAIVAPFAFLPKNDACIFFFDRSLNRQFMMAWKLSSLAMKTTFFLRALRAANNPSKGHMAVATKMAPPALKCNEDAYTMQK